MTRPLIFLMRHGEAGLNDTRRYIGQSDVALTDKGRMQAEAWADWFADISLGRIATSDLRRTRDTAAIIAESRGLKAELIPQLREINLGEWEGTPIEEIKTHHPDQYDHRGRDLAGYRPPGGECFLDVQERSLKAFKRLTLKMEDSLLIVSHAGVNRTLLCAILGMPLANLFQLRQDYASLNIVEPRGNGYRLSAVNITLENRWAG